MQMSSDLCPPRHVEIYCISQDETDQNLYCNFGDRQAWIPKKQIHDNSEVWLPNQNGLLVIPQDLAKKKGLV
jgi:hypothetical protein